jgi:hypothetical protein
VAELGVPVPSPRSRLGAHLSALRAAAEAACAFILPADPAPLPPPPLTLPLPAPLLPEEASLRALGPEARLPTLLVWLTLGLPERPLLLRPPRLPPMNSGALGATAGGGTHSSGTTAMLLLAHPRALPPASLDTKCLGAASGACCRVTSEPPATPSSCPGLLLLLSAPGGLPLLDMFPLLPMLPRSLDRKLLARVTAPRLLVTGVTPAGDPAGEWGAEQHARSWVSMNTKGNKARVETHRLVVNRYTPGLDHE